MIKKVILKKLKKADLVAMFCDLNMMSDVILFVI